MKPRNCASFWGLMLLVAGLLTSVAAAQAVAPPPSPHDGFLAAGPVGGMMGGEFGDGKAVAGAPLTADLAVTRDTTLADGNTIHTESQAKVYRDSQGRTRREINVDLTTPATGNVKRNMIVINDSVTGQRYVLNPENKTARQMQIHGPRHRGPGPDGEGRDPAMGGGAGPAGSESVKKEDLGTKTVNGIQAQGVRVTRTIAAGAIGNSKPIDAVTERWYSPELQMVILTIHTDPMMGTVTSKLTNITKTDPDASLFQVPPDYKVEAGRPNEPMYMPMKP